MTKLKRLTINQTQQLANYQAQKVQELLLFGCYTMSTEDVESIIKPLKPFAYLTK